MRQFFFITMLFVLLSCGIAQAEEFVDSTTESTAKVEKVESESTTPKGEQEKSTLLKDIPDTPKPPKKKEIKAPVSIEHKGADNVGERFAYHLKELYNKSSLFRVSLDDEKKIKVLLITREEFKGRPNVSSLYDVVWVYSENEGTLKYYLANEIGLIHASSLKEAAEALVGKTHEIYSRYSYLFE